MVRSLFKQAHKWNSYSIGKSHITRILNLSKNYLYGQIHQCKQFNTFMNDSYSGNLGLCGFPMIKSCGNDEEQPPPPSSITQEDDFKFEDRFHWKVVLLGYSCGFIFGLDLGYLMFSSG